MPHKKNRNNTKLFELQYKIEVFSVFIYLVGMALLLTVDQSDGRIPKSFPKMACSSSNLLECRFERRTFSRPGMRLFKTDDLRLERRGMVAFLRILK